MDEIDLKIHILELEIEIIENKTVNFHSKPIQCDVCLHRHLDWFLMIFTEMIAQIKREKKI